MSMKSTNNKVNAESIVHNGNTQIENKKTVHIGKVFIQQQKNDNEKIKEKVKLDDKIDIILPSGSKIEITNVPLKHADVFKKYREVTLINELVIRVEPMTEFYFMSNDNKCIVDKYYLIPNTNYTKIPNENIGENKEIKYQTFVIPANTRIVDDILGLPHYYEIDVTARISNNSRFILKTGTLFKKKNYDIIFQNYYEQSPNETTAYFK